jgi:hypothetical protein
MKFDKGKLFIRVVEHDVIYNFVVMLFVVHKILELYHQMNTLAYRKNVKKLK